MCATYRDKQKRSHFESFANKIFTGIREINPEYAEKRAIWELFQNALDTVDKNGQIEITKTENGLLFKHNGRPFKDDEFGGLIKQFSVGKSYGDNKEKLGQYGTGFISTHVYGKKIKVNGSILTDDGSFRTLKDFEIDRSAESIDELTDKLITQDEFIERLCDNPELAENFDCAFTSFEYQASTNNLVHIDAMLQYIKTILPYIFCFNNKLNKVNLSYDSINSQYERKETSDIEVNISVDGEPIKVPIIQNNEKNVKVILADENRELIDIPKQFLFYPLMETTEIGYNFIIHANDFKPNKERDYLHSDNSNEELKADVEINQNLLQTAFNLVLEKVKEDESISFIDIARIEFTRLDSDFEKELKKNYINTIKSLERIRFNNVNKSIESLIYFDKSVLLLDEDIKLSIYSLLKQFRSLPHFEIYCELSKNINNWNEYIDNKFETLTHENIGEIISKESGGNLYFIQDKTSFEKFVSEIAIDITLLNKIALIPNIHGDFKFFEDLVKWESNEPALVEIVDSINADISKSYIHKNFEFLENVNLYNREKFKEEFSKFCNELIDDLSKGKINLLPNSIRFRKLTEAMTSFISLNKKTQLNVDIAAFYNRIYKLQQNSNLNIFSDPTVDVNYQPAIKLLANLYFSNIKEKEVVDKISDLKEIISVMFKNTNLKEELLHKLACFPNQRYVLKSQTDLEKDEVKDNDFKNVFYKITNNDIRNELALDGFEVFLQHNGTVTGYQLGDSIEANLNSEKKFIPVDTNIIETVLELIEKISERPNLWGQWLPNINRVKEEVLMHKFQDEKTRSSLFSILAKDEKTIELLGDLAKIEDLESLIKAGKEKQKEEKRKSNHLIYINEIGLMIQNLIKEKLDISLANTIEIIKSLEDANLQNIEEQNGQDFIIYKDGIPVYYIEVKSRWDSEGIVALSKRQIERCAENEDKYAVITVNVADYKSRNNNILEDNITFEQLSNDIYVNLDLSENFNKLISENKLSENIRLNTKLIEFRGHIPQDRIKKGIDFVTFIENLKQLLTN